MEKLFDTTSSDSSKIQKYFLIPLKKNIEFYYLQLSHYNQCKKILIVKKIVNNFSCLLGNDCRNQQYISHKYKLPHLMQETSFWLNS